MTQSIPFPNSKFDGLLGTVINPSGYSFMASYFYISNKVAPISRTVLILSLLRTLIQTLSPFPQPSILNVITSSVVHLVPYNSPFSLIVDGHDSFDALPIPALLPP